jgi:hypothetical protein
MGCNCKSSDDMIVQMVKIWGNVQWPSKEIKAEANRRVQVCISSNDGKPCPFNKNLICKQSGSWIPALARNMNLSCPINRW